MNLKQQTNGMDPIDVEIKGLVDQATDLNKRYAKTIKLYRILIVIMALMIFISGAKTYQAHIALGRYEEGLVKVDELSKIMGDAIHKIHKSDSLRQVVYKDLNE